MRRRSPPALAHYVSVDVGAARRSTASITTKAAGSAKAAATDIGSARTEKFHRPNKDKASLLCREAHTLAITARYVAFICDENVGRAPAFL